jgi:hypothetical protein
LVGARATRARDGTSVAKTAILALERIVDCKS